MRIALVITVLAILYFLMLCLGAMLFNRASSFLICVFAMVITIPIVSLLIHYNII